MKRNLLLASSVLVAGALSAQTFTDNFDGYTAGDNIGEQADWTTWSGTGGGADDLAISTGANAFSASNYLNLVGVGAGGPADIVKDFGGEYNYGQFDMEAMIFVEAGKNAYFNLQQNTTIGQVWACDFNFNADGSFRLNNQIDGDLITGTYTQGQYIKVAININLSTNTWELFIDDVSQGSFSNSSNQVASLNLYPIENTAYRLDDFAYTITPYTLPAENLGVTQVNSNGVLAGQTKAASVKVRNLGTSAITSFDIEVEYNGTTLTETVTGVNIASLAYYDVAFTSDFTLIEGMNDMTATITNVNGTAGDDDVNDDVKMISVDPVTPAAGKVVVGEEGTGTWCGWCPRGAVNMDIMSNDFDGFWAGLAVHNGDPMTDPVYDTGIDALIGGYPSSVVDRGAGIDPADMRADFLQRIVVAPRGVLTPGAEFNAATRELKISVTVDFDLPANDQYKLAIAITEDDVTGTDAGYAQQNYYSFGSNDLDLFDPAGYNWRDLPATVPAAQMVYDHVARGIFPSFAGATGFPEVVNAGEQYTISITTTLPAEWDETKMHIVGMLIDAAGRIDNAGTASVTEAIANGYTASTDEVAYEVSNPVFEMYPNPASASTKISFVNENNAEVSLKIIDLAGNVISARDYGQVFGSSSITVNTAEYAKGIYAVELTLGGKKEVKKLVIR